MSQINVNQIVDASGGVLAPISSVHRNRIINGAMTITQRGTSSVAADSGNLFAVDRWFGYNNTTSKFTMQQDAGAITPPAGFTDYLGATSTSAYSVGSSDYFGLTQRIEGFNVADLGWGTANAATVTLSFWVRSSLTGTFGGNFSNAAYNRGYPFTYTISAANTWEYKTVTVAGDTTGTWGTTNGLGIELVFSLGTGSSYNATANAWTNAWRFPTGATSVVGTNGATFYITGVQLEKGTQATGFEYRQIGTELQLCQRYAYKLMPGIQLSKMRELDRTRQGFFIMPVQMRTTVTVGAMATTDGISVIIDNLSDRGFSMYLTATSDGMGAGINTQALVTAEL